MRIFVRREESTPPGAENRSRPHSYHRNPGGPADAIVVVVDGARRRKKTEAAGGNLSEVGSIHTIDEVIEGNEMMEKRDRPERNVQREATGQIQSWQPVQPHLLRVNAAARRSGQTLFTSLLHHVDVAALKRAFRRQRRAASPGADGVTMAMYEQNLESNLQGLHDRVHAGHYWPQPVVRVQIPKPDGGKRPLGIPALEDKLLQSAVAEVLSAVYEADFLDYSYGFRPARSAHQALAALEKSVMTQYVNYVLDVDIASFFDSVDHGWLMRMLSHRIADRRVLRLIERWLKAGILESGRRIQSETGTPQGSGISPLLANVFLHYIFDLWIAQQRRRARGHIVVCRYADDLVLGFQYKDQAQKLFAALRERFAKFGLSLHEGKTRLIEFGRFASENRSKAGLRRPETFNFLGFTHYCSRTRSGRFTVKRKTQAKRLNRKLVAVRVEMKRRRHRPLAEQYTWLSHVLNGHYRYYGVIFNARSLNAFYEGVKRAWFQSLRKRSQRSRMNWERFHRILATFALPKPIIHQSWYRAIA